MYSLHKYRLRAFNRYRPLSLRTESEDEDAGSRDPLLPRSTHNPPALYSYSRIFTSYRQRPVPQKAGSILLSFLGSFFGVALVATLSRSRPFHTRDVPLVVGRYGSLSRTESAAETYGPASFEAEAVLLYAAPTSPLTQVRLFVYGFLHWHKDRHSIKFCSRAMLFSATASAPSRYCPCKSLSAAPGFRDW